MSVKLRAVIVDDDVAVARIHHRFVASHASFEVVGEAHSGAAAVSQLERLRPNVVLLDFYLPDFSGLDVLGRLSVERRRHLDVIAVTADRDLESVRQARTHGVRHYLVKPFTTAALFERLDEVARHHDAMDGRSREETLDQRSIDELIASPNGRPVLPPKGISDTTLERVLLALQAAETDMSSAELAEQVGISRVGARRYLEHLVALGRVTRTPRYGTTGRPENRYTSAS